MAHDMMNAPWHTLEDDFLLQEQMNTDGSMLARRSTDWLERFLQGDADWRAEVKIHLRSFHFCKNVSVQCLFI